MNISSRRAALQRGDPGFAVVAGLEYCTRRMRPLHHPLHRTVLIIVCGVAIIAGAGAYYALRWPSYAAFTQSIDVRCKQEYSDFTLYYLRQARQILLQDTPVRRYFYSPTFALLLVPIARLPDATAWQVWTWVQAASLALFLIAGGMAMRGFPPWTYLLGLALTLTSYPVVHNWIWGQCNTLFIACVVFALLAYERGAVRRAALLLSWIAALRYYPALYLVGFSGRKARAAWLWFGLSISVWLIALPVLIMGAEHARNFYLASFASIDLATHTWLVDDRASLYLPTTVLRVARAAGLGLGPRGLWLAVSSLLTAANVAHAVWAVRSGVASRTLWAFSLMALSTPLVFSTSWVHYFVYLPLVQAFLAGELSRARSRSPRAAAACMLLWIASVALSSMFFFQLIGDVRRYERRGFLLWSDLALLALGHALLGAMHARRNMFAPIEG